MRRRSLTSGNGGGRKGSKEVSDPLTESASYFTRVSKVANTRHPLAPLDGVVLLAHRLSSSFAPFPAGERERGRERRVYFRWDGVKVKRSHVPRAAVERHLTGTSGKTGTRWNFEPTPSPSLFHRVDRKTDFEAPLAAEIEQISATTHQGALCLCAWDEDKERGGGGGWRWRRWRWWWWKEEGGGRG